MPTKVVEVPSVGLVRLYKRRGVRHIRISIASNGEVRVTMPPWAPYRLGYEFAISKTEWIIQRRPVESMLVHNGQIGKAHRLYFAVSPNATKIRTRVKDQGVWVYLPPYIDQNSTDARKAATKAATRVLILQAELLLLPRLQNLASEHGFSYRSAAIKRLRSRWGSCNQHTDIMLNCYLMQLPWDLIDYVLLHELLHTKIMSHGAPFWKELEHHVNNLSFKRQEIRKYHPILETL